jgi:Acetyltransferase (GNAT) family
MYVDPEARDRGLGRSLLEALEDDVIRHGMTRMILETGARNHAALSLYAACGYTRVPSYVAGRDPGINRAMRKTLSPPAVKPAGQSVHAVPAASAGYGWARPPASTCTPPSARPSRSWPAPPFSLSRYCCRR